MLYIRFRFYYIMLKNDRRIVRTHDLLAKALIELTLERGYDAVTIRDITERADVGYATFFRHYADKEALLQEVLHVFVEELTEKVSNSGNEADAAEEGRVIFEYIYQHSALCRLLLASKGTSTILKTVEQSGHMTKRLPSQETVDTKVPVEIALNHWLAATIALIDWWLQHEMPYTPAQMGEIYRKLIVLPTQALI
ncbi:MAG: TetR/AcrR family transcriptional regulator [Caldilineaceae bacterium]